MTNLKKKISLNNRSEQSETKLNQTMNQGEKKLELVKKLRKIGQNKSVQVRPEQARRGWP